MTNFLRILTAYVCLYYGHQSTEFTPWPYPGTSDKLRVDYLQIGGTYFPEELGHGVYVVGGIGATRMVFLKFPRVARCRLLGLETDWMKTIIVEKPRTYSIYASTNARAPAIWHPSRRLLPFT